MRLAPGRNRQVMQGAIRYHITEKTEFCDRGLFWMVEGRKVWNLSSHLIDIRDQLCDDLALWEQSQAKPCRSLKRGDEGGAMECGSQVSQYAWDPVDEVKCENRHQNACVVCNLKDRRGV